MGNQIGILGPDTPLKRLYSAQLRLSETSLDVNLKFKQVMIQFYRCKLKVQMINEQKKSVVKVGLDWKENQLGYCLWIVW